MMHRVASGRELDKMVWKMVTDKAIQSVNGGERGGVKIHANAGFLREGEGGCDGKYVRGEAGRDWSGHIREGFQQKAERR